MANQAIALGVRGPQVPDLARVNQQYGQIMNMMAQQRAAERQAAQAQQAMAIAAAKEGREQEMFAPQMAEAKAKATEADIKTGLDFNNFVRMAIANSTTPDQVAMFAERIANIPQFQTPLYQGVLQDAIANMPRDPAQFQSWRKETYLGTLEADKRYKQQTVQQNLGTSTRVLSIPEFGGAATVVPGSEAAVNLKPTVVNVDGFGPVIVDPNTGRGFPVAPGDVGGYSPPPVGGGGGAPVVGGSPVAKALQTNPGALKDGPFARSQPGYTGSSGGFATFDSPQAGIAAQERLLTSAYVGKGFNTIDKIVNRYAPQGPENSAASVSNYKKYISQQTGIDINAPISAGQIPAVAQAMREFETGQTKGRGAAGAAEKPPKTFGQMETQRGFQKTLELFDYNPKTGADSVTPLIMASTSGRLQKIGSQIVSDITGEATSGRVALEQLQTLKDNMTFEKLRGKLGAQISDADVRLVASTMGDIANPDIAANARAAKWRNIVLPILVRGAGLEPVKRAPPPPPQGPRKTPTTGTKQKRDLKDIFGG